MRSEITPTDSVWSHDADLPTYGPLTQDLRVRVAVVGAGIAGLSTAYQLVKRGFPVAVIDDGPIGGGDTGATTAQATCIVDKGYAETAKLRGEDGARLTAESQMAAIDTIERIAREESIACDFARMDGYLFLTEGDTRSTLSDERDAAVRAGLVDVELLSAGVSLGDARLAPALRFPRQAHVHQLKYLAGLCRAIERMGGQIFCGTHVTKVNPDAHSSPGASVTLETAEGLAIYADTVVLATHMPINDAIRYSTRLSPSLTYVIGLRIPKGSLPNFLAFDTDDPYHYVRIQPEGDHDVLIVGGEDHKTGQADDMDLRYLRLESWAREQFPMAGEVRYRWSSKAEIPAGSGAIIGWGPSKVAAYRDDQGVLHRRSALCSHLGCVVAWNDSAKTWDCPCHGSRYDSYGKVMNGPAPSHLSPVDE